MAEATAVASGIAGQSMAMADKLINRLMDSKDRDKGNNDTTATVVKEVMEVMGDADGEGVGCDEECVRTDGGEHFSALR